MSFDRQLEVVSAKDFLAFPSPTKLVQMGPNCGEALLKEFGGDETNIDQVTKAIFKAAIVVNKEDEAKNRACQCADDLLRSVFLAIPNADILIINALLVLMGLIKSEDKKQKVPSSITGPLLVLEHVVRQSYFSVISREILLCFLCKPHPVLDKSSEATHKILQTLYSF